MVSLNPMDYFSPCDLLPAGWSFLCRDLVPGVPIWMLVAALVGFLALLMLVKLVLFYLKLVTPLL